MHVLISFYWSFLLVIYLFSVWFAKSHQRICDGRSNSFSLIHCQDTDILCWNNAFLNREIRTLVDLVKNPVTLSLSSAILCWRQADFNSVVYHIQTQLSQRRPGPVWLFSSLRVRKTSPGFLSFLVDQFGSPTYSTSLGKGLGSSPLDQSDSFGHRLALMHHVATQEIKGCLKHQVHQGQKSSWFWLHHKNVHHTPLSLNSLDSRGGWETLSFLYPLTEDAIDWELGTHAPKINGKLALLFSHNTEERRIRHKNACVGGFPLAPPDPVSTLFPLISAPYGLH